MISAGGYQICPEKAYTDQWWGFSVPLKYNKYMVLVQVGAEVAGGAFLSRLVYLTRAFELGGKSLFSARSSQAKHGNNAPRLLKKEYDRGHTLVSRRG